MKQIVDLDGAADAVSKSLPPTIALSKAEITELILGLLAKKLASQKNVYYAVKLADGSFMGDKKARIFNSKGAATQSLSMWKHVQKYAGAKVVPVAMGEIKFEIEA